MQMPWNAKMRKTKSVKCNGKYEQFLLLLFCVHLNFLKLFRINYLCARSSSIRLMSTVALR